MSRQRTTESQDYISSALQTRSHSWLWMLFFVLLSAGGIFATVKFFSSTSKKLTEQPLDGKLNVFVRTSQRGVEPLPIENAGALPVQADGIMSLEANLSQPACVYFVWLDCERRVLPLYPWNDETLEVTDINQLPPSRMGAKVVFCPPLGGGWSFGKKGGIETVMLLARRKPLDSNVSLGSLLNLPLPPQLRHREELVGFGVNRGDDSVSTLISKHRGDDEESRAEDEHVKTMMLRLREHFELIRVVRFTHKEES